MIARPSEVRKFMERTGNRKSGTIYDAAKRHGMNENIHEQGISVVPLGLEKGTRHQRL